MRERLHPLDASFLYLEDAAGPAHVASLAVLEGPVGYEELCRLLGRRLTLVPRYRQKIKPVPGGLAQPVWADDASFDVTYHVRRSELPRPGSPEQLHELVARICARRLDRRRPLWEMYLIDGLADGRAALLTKTHGAMLDGVAPDLTQVIFDNGPRPRRVRAQQWRPHPEPPDVTLVADAIGELARRPSQLVGALGRSLLDAGKALSTVAGAASEMLEAARTAARPAPPSPLNREIGEQRRYSTVSTCLDDYRRVRKAYDVSVTDVVLATVAGALRAWLMMRGELVTRSSVLRAMVPVSVREGLDQEAVGSGAVRVSPVLVDLPVGEPNPTVRLHQIAYALHAPRQAGRFARVDRMAAYAPPTWHALGAKAASRLSRRLYNLVVTNVPGPQQPLYLASVPVLESYPVAPLAEGQALAIAATSYRGGVYYGLNADRESMPDLDVLGDLIAESLAELVETVR